MNQEPHVHEMGGKEHAEREDKEDGYKEGMAF